MFWVRGFGWFGCAAAAGGGATATGGIVCGVGSGRSGIYSAVDHASVFHSELFEGGAIIGKGLGAGRIEGEGLGVGDVRTGDCNFSDNVGLRRGWGY